MRSALLLPLLLLFGSGPVLGQSADLLSNRAVAELAEEALIADLMLRSCEGVIGSEQGVVAITDYADRLARSAGYEPAQAAALLSEPAARARLESGAISRLARMGARPDDLTSLCRVARGVAGRGGVLGTLLLPR
ncbi:hypothetical protein IQ03_01319 [Gemmobacter caeni]|jgi:hypothetical protein|uniref:Uncharacterized protein n=1 Tax=Gemmobacter caeni TaxID=589035 RepID=A0A2T6B8P1_9RHOB|nr:DUF5333 family protein [Gemmobacter caeni]PTX52429.1 hypothetical protein C8N34_102208 [Gemmobacter caeni]TWJ02900.1 hypothetical protein IQ03_01319 [Gemmobacter caeni]